MKKFTLLILALILVLCGCGTDSDPQSTQPTVATPDQAVPEVTEPATFAQLDTSEVETVERYQIAQADYYGLCPMGEGILLFSGKTETTLTYVTMGNLPVRTTLSQTFITPEDPSVLATDRDITYYNATEHALVTLDLDLKPVSKIALPEDVPGVGALSEDGKLFYYYTNNALRCLDLRSGISRLLKESNFDFQQVERLHFGGDLLECTVLEGASSQTLLVSAQTGEVLFSSTIAPSLFTGKVNFFAVWQEGDERLELFGLRGEGIQKLLPLWDGAFWAYPDQGRAAAWQIDQEGLHLSWYDLKENGTCASVVLKNVSSPVGVVAEAESGALWVLAMEPETEEFAFYRWDAAADPVAEEVQTLAPYYTAESPDLEGLERCQEKAEALSQQYSIQLKIWEDALKVAPKDYQLTPEYSVERYEKLLPLLEKAISTYPEEIYQKLSKKSDNKKLTVCLVREIQGSDELGSPTQEQGVYFIKGGSSYLVLTLNEQIESIYYHELFHAMDSYVIMAANSYDDWNDLNPEGFAYDNSYIDNANRDPQHYLDPENRAFIDVYSMSYPKEDRARVMEYAMGQGNEQYFTSEIMAKKLDKLCQGIRKAFKLQKDERVFPWEQYLIGEA